MAAKRPQTPPAPPYDPGLAAHLADYPDPNGEDLPPLPAGFALDARPTTQATPPLPAGFTLDAPSMAPQSRAQIAKQTLSDYQGSTKGIGDLLKSLAYNFTIGPFEQAGQMFGQPFEAHRQALAGMSGNERAAYLAQFKMTPIEKLMAPPGTYSDAELMAVNEPLFNLGVLGALGSKSVGGVQTGPGTGFFRRIPETPPPPPRPMRALPPAPPYETLIGDIEALPQAEQQRLTNLQPEVKVPPRVPSASERTASFDRLQAQMDAEQTAQQAAGAEQRALLNQGPPPSTLVKGRVPQGPPPLDVPLPTEEPGSLLLEQRAAAEGRLPVPPGVMRPGKAVTVAPVKPMAPGATEVATVSAEPPVLKTTTGAREQRLAESKPPELPLGTGGVVVVPPEVPPAQPQTPSASRMVNSLIQGQRTAFTPLTEGLQKGAQIVDDIKRAFAPASRGPLAQQMAGITREEAARLAAKTERAQHTLKKAELYMEGLSLEEQLKFIHSIETSEVQANPQLQPISASLRSILDQRKAEVQGLGKGFLDNFIENYFPHIWKDPEKARNVFAEAYGRRPLGGSGAFLKQRTVPTTQEGVALGLEPASTNPVTLALLKIREMDRFVMKEHIVTEMKAEGLAKFVKFGQPAPEGWVKIQDKAFRVLQYSEAEKGFVARGDYYAPEQAATILNRYLSPGLRGNVAYDLYRGAGNSLNQAQLGISAFHLGFTALDTAISKVALGIQQLSVGEIVGGGKSIAQGLAPGVAPVSSFLKGNRMFREFYAPGSEGPEIAAALDRYITGGGRMVMDRFYTNSAVENFWKALRSGQYVGAGRRAFPALIEALAKPTMEVIVPRMKAGVAADLTRFELSQLPPNATKDMQRAVFGRATDSVDNRLGQLVYDNLFWHRALKDLGLASVRSLGWNIGTFRELGGGLSDVLTQTGKVFKGQRPVITSRMAYTAALPFVVGLYGGILYYLYNGKPPEELKDYYFPKTGVTNPNGTEARVSLPSYMKDIYAYSQHPLTTLGHKVNPAVSTVIDMLKNEDYYGAAIRDPNDPLVTQARDEMAYAAKQYEPFSFRGVRRQLQEGKSLSSTLPNFIGATPAPASISRTAEENAAIERRQSRQALRKKQRQANEPNLRELFFNK